MLAHFIPRFLCNTDRTAVDLFDITIFEIGLTLRNREQVCLVKPFINKNYYVVSQIDERAMGILIDFSPVGKKLSVRTRWKYKDQLLIHNVIYKIVGDMCSNSAITDDHAVFCPHTKLSLNLFPTMTPLNSKPRMQSGIDNSRNVDESFIKISDTVKNGILVQRDEVVHIKTIPLHCVEFSEGVNYPNYKNRIII